MIHLLLIRHATSIGNEAGYMSGQVDYGLSQNGMQEAFALKKYLLQQGGSQQDGLPTHLYTSPLQRARQTAQILAPPCQRVADDRLQEIDNGILSGLTWEQAMQRYPELCTALERSPNWFAIPGAESPQNCHDRATSFIQTLLQTHANGDRVWAITHGGILPYLVAALLGNERTWGFETKPTALFEFWWDCDRWSVVDQNRFNPTLWQVKRFNDLTHLSTVGQQ